MPWLVGSRVDDNLWGRTIGRRGDNGSTEPEEAFFKKTKRLDDTPARPAHVEVEFESGAAIGINGVTMPFMEMIESLATIAGEHGVGRLDRIKVRADGTRSARSWKRPPRWCCTWRMPSSGGMCRRNRSSDSIRGIGVVCRGDRSRRMV